MRAAAHDVPVWHRKQLAKGLVNGCNARQKPGPAGAQTPGHGCQLKKGESDGAIFLSPVVILRRASHHKGGSAAQDNVVSAFPSFQERGTVPRTGSAGGIPFIVSPDNA